MVRGESWEREVKNGESRFFSQPTNQEFLKMPQRCICGVFTSISAVLRYVFVVGGVLCRMRVWGSEGVVMFCDALYVRQSFCWLRCAPGWRTLPQREGANFNSKRVVDPMGGYLVYQLKDVDWSDQEFVMEGLSYYVSPTNVNATEDFSVSLESEAANAEEVMDLVSFTSIVHVVFDWRFSVDVSAIAVSPAEVTSANATLIAFNRTGSGLPVSTIYGGSARKDRALSPILMSTSAASYVSYLLAMVRSALLRMLVPGVNRALDFLRAHAFLESDRSGKDELVLRTEIIDLLGDEGLQALPWLAALGDWWWWPPLTTTCALGRILRGANALMVVVAPAILFLWSCVSGTWIERDRVRGGCQVLFTRWHPFSPFPCSAVSLRT